MNGIYYVKAILPGFDINDTYLVLAKSEEDAREKILKVFPNSEISYIKKQDDNLIFTTHGLAYSPLFGGQR